MFYNVGPWCRCYKTFYSRNLRIFFISQSVCTWQAFPAQSNVFGQGQEPTQEWSTKGSLFEETPVLPSNIRLGWKGHQGQTLQFILKIRKLRLNKLERLSLAIIFRLVYDMQISPDSTRLGHPMVPHTMGRLRTYPQTSDKISQSVYIQKVFSNQRNTCE